MEKKIFTDSGIEINSLYQPEDGYINRELPGQYPFTRGIRSDMYRSRLWTMRQYAGFSTARESNKRYHYLLSQGVSGLSVAFDLPTQIGYDSDHILAEGEVGKVGVAIDSIRDMEELFAGIPLENMHTAGKYNHFDDYQCNRFYSPGILCSPCKKTGS
jgi:methylmalonyl-CoA mutase, N-terminal domain